MKPRLLAIALASLALSAGLLLKSPAAPAADTKPLRVLLVTGGCCHDYANQRLLLAEGLSKRANIQVEFAHTDDKGTKPNFPIYNNADWAKGFDVVIHDECAADVMDQPYVNNIVNAHKDGVPAVNLHCAMHSYRKGFKVGEPIAPGSEQAIWFDMLGLQSNRHGPQEPIAITHTDKAHPITKGLEDWTTIKEELYNNVQDPKNFPGHHTLATGKQIVKNKDGTTKEEQSVITWTNSFGPKKTRIFSTTIGHNNDTVSDARYMDLVTRGVLWAAGKLGDDGKPAAGYEAKSK
ncbi:MAG TPA: ThuA domain-containing protein [Candidatus Saccharimonadia bacterium]|nr:ThuA domain-containing protein [Candidatus Saccharimonadia bacterium]